MSRSPFGHVYLAVDEPKGDPSSGREGTQLAETDLHVRSYGERHVRLYADTELFATYRHHAFITNSTLAMIEADQRHRDHAVIEQVIAELKDNALAHLPSAKYAANAAWVSCAVITFNIARATAVAAGIRTARWTTVRRKVITIPARIAATSRRLVLHLPTHWPWARAWELLWSTATAPPPAPTT